MLSAILSLAHLIGLGLAVGAATVKLALLFKCRVDSSFVPVYTRVARPITRQIVLGLILLTLSGIGWVAVGYSLTPLLIVKIVIVAAIWIIGPVIDNVVEPRFQALAPRAGEVASPAFFVVQKQYLALETAATLLFYVIVVIWVMR